jgi:hypothetical protein
MVERSSLSVSTRSPAPGWPAAARERRPGGSRLGRASVASIDQVMDSIIIPASQKVFDAVIS